MVSSSSLPRCIGRRVCRNVSDRFSNSCIAYQIHDEDRISSRTKAAACHTYQINIGIVDSGHFFFNFYLVGDGNKWYVKRRSSTKTVNVLRWISKSMASSKWRCASQLEDDLFDRLKKLNHNLEWINVVLSPAWINRCLKVKATMIHLLASMTRTDCSQKHDAMSR